MLVDKIYTIDIVVVNSQQITRQVHHLMQEVIAIRLRHKHIHLLYRNKQQPASLLHLRSLLLLRLILAPRTIIDQSR